jgi:RHS repeat-associated protein
MHVRAILSRAFLFLTVAAGFHGATGAFEARAQQLVAEAGPDRTVAVGETVVLDGSGSLDPKEMTADFAWRFVSHPTDETGWAPVLAAPNAVEPRVSVKPSFVADLPGEYVLELVLTESNRISAPDRVVITTTNSAPRADAGPDQAIGVGDWVVLDGSASTDSDGDALTYSWTVTDPLGDPLSLTGVNPGFEATLSGTYSAELTVDDGVTDHLYTDHVTDTVTISTVNVPPVAVAGPDITAVVGETVQFDGSLSHDRNGDELSYSWSLISVPVLPVPSAEELAYPSDVRATLVVDKEGIFLVQLTVTDANGAVSRDTLVVSTVNAAPLANAGPDQVVAPGDTVELDAGGTTDWNGDFLRFRWALVAKPATSGAALDDPASPRPSFTADAAGTYVAQLVVDDGADPAIPYPSEQGAADTVVIIAGPGNALPAADAGPPQTVAIGDTVQLDATGTTDANGDALTYSWTVLEDPNGNKPKFSDPASPTPTFTFSKFGEHVLQVTVSDGERSDVDTVLLTTINTRPFANPGPEQPAIPGDVIQLNGATEPDGVTPRSRDIDGDPILFEWSLIVRPAGSTAILQNPTTATPTIATDLPGYYIAQLIVHEESVTNPLTITKSSLPETMVVAAPNSPPVADAGADQTVYVDDRGPVTLDGTGSSDADDDALTYAWSFASRPTDSTAALDDATAPQPSFTPDFAGEYVVQLIVNDGKVDSAPDSVSVFVLNPPVAEAGPEQTVSPLPYTVQLDGTASTSETGTQTHAWRFTARPADSDPLLSVLSDPAAASPTFVADVPGLYVLDLVVSDGTRTSAPDTVGVRAGTGVFNTPPVLTPVGPQTVELGATLTVTLSATDADGDPFYFFASPLPLPAGATLDAASGVFTFRPDADQVGVHTITFGVSDGLDSDSESVQITVAAPPAGTATAVTGRLVDAEATSQGVAGATVTIVGTGVSVVTETDGGFTLETPGIGGDQVLEIDAAGTGFAGRRQGVTLIADAVNALGDFALARIDVGTETPYNLTGTTFVDNAALGATVTIAGGTAKDANGNDFAGSFTLSDIPPAEIAALLPPFVSPCQVLTLQSSPGGVTFTSAASVTLGNPDNLPPGAIVDIWGVSPVTGASFIATSGTVSADGLSIEVGSLVGRTPSVFFATPRAPAVTAAADMNGDTLTRSLLGSGNVSQAITLPGYTSLGEERTQTLVYNSGAADSRPIIAAETLFAAGATLPAKITGTLSVGGVTVAGPVYMDTAIASDAADPGFSNGQAIRQALQFDASDYASGAHPYRYVTTARYGCSSVGAAVDGRIVTENQADSPFGKGWTLAGLEKLSVQPDGSVLLSEGDGTARVFDVQAPGEFLDPVGYPAAGPLAGVLDDLDGDGNLDMAIPSTGTGDVELLFGDGSGGFPVTRRFNAGLPWSVYQLPDVHTIQSGDFDNNGIRDLVVNNQMSDKVRVYLGTGGGFYAAPIILDLSRPMGLGVADFDLDGNDDIAVGRGNADIGSNAVVYFGNGAGGFPSRFVAKRLGGNQVGLEIADFDNNGIPDIALATAKPKPLNAGNKIHLLLSNGARNFGYVTKHDVGVVRREVGRFPLAAADYNGDGNQDLALTVDDPDVNIEGDEFVRIYFGDGFGNFPAKLDKLTGFLTNTVRAFDFDRDGDMDIAATGRYVGNVALLAGDGAGGFELATTIPVATGGLASAVLPGDFNHDGALDLQVSSNGEDKIFALIADAGFRSPGADFSQLTQNEDGTWVRRMTDGTTIEYNEDGLMTARVDSNGNRAEYTYAADGLLSGVSDPANPNRGTLFAYTDGTLSSITEPSGRSTFFTVDANGDLVKMTDAGGNEWRYAYDANSKLSAFASARGFVTTVDYGFAGQYLGTNNPDGTSITASIAGDIGLTDFELGLGTEATPEPSVAPEDRIATLQDAKGNLYEMEVNEYGALIRVIDPIGRETRFVHDADNLVRQSIRDNDGLLPDGTAPATVTMLLDYDDRGNTISRTEAAGTTLERTTRFEYEPVFNRVVKIVDPSNTAPDPACPTAGVPNQGVTCMEYDPANGDLLKVIDAGGGVQEFSYDPRGLRETATDANGNATTFTYDFYGNIETATNGAGDVTKMLRNDAGEVEGLTEGFGTLEARTTTYVFDDLGRIVQETDPEGGVMETVYDADGNTIAEIDATGIAKTNEYDEMGRLATESHPATGTVTRLYDENGNLKSMIDPTGSISHLSYDEVNRLDRAEDPAGGVRLFAYDLQDDPEQVVDANGNATNFKYDVHGRAIERSNALGNTWTFAYDSRDNMTKMVDAKGQTTNKTYDELSRLRRIELVEADGLTIEDTVTFEFDALGLRKSAVDTDSLLIWSYDGANRVQTAATVAAPGAVQPAVVLTHFYDAVGNRTDLSHGPDTVIVDGIWSYLHNGNGALNRVTTPTGDTIDLAYDAASRLERVAYPTATGTQVSFGATTGRPDRIKHSVNETSLAQFDYGFDIDGKILSVADGGGTREFTYDATLQLTGGGYPNTPESYAYDAQGNRISSHLSASYSHDDANRLREDAETCYDYDANGNLVTRREKVGLDCTDTSGAATTYEWDVLNRLVRIDFPDGTYAAYRYDAFGRRVLKDFNGALTRYVYDGDAILLEYDGADVLQARYSHGEEIDQPLAIERAGQSFFYHTDYLGSVQLLTDVTGAVANAYDYDAFGNLEATSFETVANPYGFSGRERDAESGLMFYRARYYDPKIGRFISEDPIGFHSGDSNLYRYVANGPNLYVDPQGLTGEEKVVSAASIGGLQALRKGLVCAFGGIASIMELVGENMKWQSSARIVGKTKCGAVVTVIRRVVKPIACFVIKHTGSKLKGVVGEAIVRIALRITNFAVKSGRRWSFWNGQARRHIIPDFVSKIGSQLVYLEVKTGPSADLSSAQRLGYRNLAGHRQVGGVFKIHFKNCK